MNIFVVLRVSTVPGAGEGLVGHYCRPQGEGSGCGWLGGIDLWVSQCRCCFVVCRKKEEGSRCKVVGRRKKEEKRSHESISRKLRHGSISRKLRHG